MAASSCDEEVQKNSEKFRSIMLVSSIMLRGMSKSNLNQTSTYIKTPEAVITAKGGSLKPIKSKFIF